MMRNGQTRFILAPWIGEVKGRDGTGRHRVSLQPQYLGVRMEHQPDHFGVALPHAVEQTIDYGQDLGFLRLTRDACRGPEAEHDEEWPDAFHSCSLDW